MEHMDHKLIDCASSVAATLNNVGPGLGTVGPRYTYTYFTPQAKFLFIWLMMIGRLEIFTILGRSTPVTGRRAGSDDTGMTCLGVLQWPVR